jgi:hypothetical protein
VPLLPACRYLRLVRLAVKFGCEADINDVMLRLAADPFRTRSATSDGRRDAV